MKKTKSLIISAMIMVFALAFTACGSKSSSVEGSWSGNDNGYDVIHLRFLTSQRHLHYLTIQVKLNLKRVNNQMLII